MNIKKILFKLGITPYISYNEIYSGRDSSVFKIDAHDGTTYALRVLPSDRYEQFIYEKKMINLARDNGVPVPSVFSVNLLEGCSVMLMEWVSGKTKLSELQQRPGNVKS